MKYLLMVSILFSTTLYGSGPTKDSSEDPSNCHDSITAVTPFSKYEGPEYSDYHGSEITKLHLASREGNLPAVRALVEAGADIEAETGIGRTPLLESRSWKVSQYLISVGADVNHIGDENENIFLDEIYLGDFENVKFLIESGVNINLSTYHMDSIEGYSETTALELAVYSDKDQAYNIAKLLLENGADPEQIDPNSHRVNEKIKPLLIEYQIKLMKSKGYSVDSIDQGDPCKVVRYDSEKFWKNTSADKMLGLWSVIRHRFELEEILLKASLFGHLRLMKELMFFEKPDLEATDEQGNTPILNAAKGGHADVIQYLAGEGAKVHARTKFIHHNNDYYEFDIILTAAVYGQLPKLSSVFKKLKININTDSYGITALHFAARMGDLQAVKALVKAGAELEVETEIGRTPLLESRSWKVSQYLISVGADENHISSENENILLGEIYSGNFENVKFLVENGANVNLSTYHIDSIEGYSKTTALELAVYSDKDQAYNIVKLLLENGANPDQIDPNGHRVNEKVKSLLVEIQSK